MDLFGRLSSSEAAELKRLCGLYESATSRADIAVAREIRAAINDYVEMVARGDVELGRAMRRRLGFPVDPAPIVIDQ